MDPTPEELGTITTLDAACAWVGIVDTDEDPFRTELFKHLGKPRLLRQVVAIPSETWTAAIASLKITAQAGQRNPTPVEMGHVGLLRRVARLAVGLPADVLAPSQRGTSGQAPGPGQGPRQGASDSAQAPGVRKIKVSTVMDQGDDSEISPVPQEDISAMIGAWVEKVNDGEEPAEEQEATGDQLSCLQARLLLLLTPYVDFAVWRPFGARLGRVLKFQGHYQTPDGTWRARELSGPPTFLEWCRCWAVFAFAMEVLRAATRTRLARYAARIAQLNEDYPDLWWIIAMADIRCRSEHFERIRRKLAEVHRAGRCPLFNPEHPWDLVLREAARDHEFWSAQVDKKAMRWSTRLATSQQLLDGGYRTRASASAGGGSSFGGPSQGGGGSGGGSGSG